MNRVMGMITWLSRFREQELSRTFRCTPMTSKFLPPIWMRLPSGDFVGKKFVGDIRAQHANRPAAVAPPLRHESALLQVNCRTSALCSIVAADPDAAATMRSLYLHGHMPEASTETASACGRFLLNRFAVAAR